MVLGDSAIRNMTALGQIQNAEDRQVGPASLDLRLGRTFKVPTRGQEIGLGDSVHYREFTVPEGGGFVLEPHEFCLATTMECVELPAWMAGFVQGRSSIGRAGLSTQNAGFVDPGFHGHITLELKNETDCRIVMRPGYPVAQLVFMEATGVEHPYSGKYNGQVEATESRMYMDEVVV